MLPVMAGSFPVPPHDATTTKLDCRNDGTYKTLRFSFSPNLKPQKTKKLFFQKLIDLHGLNQKWLATGHNPIEAGSVMSLRFCCTGSSISASELCNN